MMIRIQLLLIITCFSLYQKTLASPVITFFMRPYPNAEKMIKKMKKPGKIARYTIERLADYSLSAGIFSTYGGFIQISNSNGQTTFPYKHQDPMVYLIITQKITPITMLDLMIDHWELVAGTPAAIYTIERKEDKETKTFYWDIKESQLPEDNKLPLKSLVIIAKPKNIFVPTGIALTQDNPNLLLPDIYVRKGIKITHNALYILNLRHFFGQLRNSYKKEETRFQHHIAE